MNTPDQILIELSDDLTIIANNLRAKIAVIDNLIATANLHPTEVATLNRLKLKIQQFLQGI